MDYRRLIRSADANILWVLFVFAGLFRLLFIITYPLNDLGGDNANYGAMMASGRSSLVHAGGYPLLVGLPFRLLFSLGEWPRGGLPLLYPSRFTYLFLLFQHTFDIAAMFVLFVVLRHIYHSAAALMGSLVYGFRLENIGSTSAVSPEWCQAVLFTVAMGAGYWALVAEGRYRKLILYGASVTLFTWCFLVKFNVALMGIIFYGVLFCAESARTIHKLLCGAVLVAWAGLNLGAYEVLYHYPSTGTLDLTYDTAWVLLTKVQLAFDNRLDPNSGVATKRWLILSGTVPRRYDLAGPDMFSHVHAVPDPVRAPYRQIYATVMAAGDRQLSDLVRIHPLPNGFVVGLSSVPICYFVGLHDGNELGIKVAREAMRFNPPVYIRSVLGDIKEAVLDGVDDTSFPVLSNMARFGLVPTRPLRRGFVEVSQPEQYWLNHFAYTRPRFWWPGLRLFSALNKWTPPAIVVSCLVGISVAAALARSIVSRRVTTREAVPLVLAGLLVSFVASSCLVLGFRWNELRVAAPLISALLGIAATWVPTELARLILNPATAPSSERG
jgi:hypothetical protein